MKIALCFAGQPRDVIGTYDNIVKYLIVPNNIEDVFVHVWWRPEFETQGFPINTDQSGRKVYMPKSILKFIEDNYKPKMMLIEDDKQIQFHPQHLITDNITPAASLDRLLPLFYSRYAVNCLKDEYKNGNNLSQYDAIVKIRFDNFIKREIKIDELDLNKISVATLWNRNIIDIRFVSDQIAISNENNMNIYSLIYYNMIEISKRVESFFGERIIGEHLIMNKIQFNEPWQYPRDMVMYRDR